MKILTLIGLNFKIRACQNEKDRLAILGMQGGYKANFDFMETMGFSEDYSPSRPYQSWGTEFVKVIEDKEGHQPTAHHGDVFEQDDGYISDPIVVKHWRQDWHYEDKTINVYMEIISGNKLSQIRKFRVNGHSLFIRSMTLPDIRDMENGNIIKIPLLGLVKKQTDLCQGEKLPLETTMICFQVLISTLLLLLDGSRAE